MIKKIFLQKKIVTTYTLRLTTVLLVLLVFYKLIPFLFSQNQNRTIYLISYFHDSFLLLFNYWFFSFFIRYFGKIKKIDGDSKSMIKIK